MKHPQTMKELDKMVIEFKQAINLLKRVKIEHCANCCSDGLSIAIDLFFNEIKAGE